MRQLLCVAILLAVFLGGCAMSTESFQTESSTLDLAQIEQDLAGLFAYCDDAIPIPPALLPSEELVNTPNRIYELAEALRDQSLDITTFREQGCFGENNRGYLEIRACAPLEDAEAKNAAQKELAAINKVRKALYYELAVYYHHGDLSVSRIEEWAARYWRTHATSVHQIQLPPKGVRFERFMETPLGRSLGNAATAESWVTLP